MSKSLMALPLVSTGNTHPSLFRERSYTEVLAGQYAISPLPMVNFDMTLYALEPARGSMRVYPRISCRSSLPDIAKKS